MVLQTSEAGQALKVRFVPSKSGLSNELSGSEELTFKKNIDGMNFKLLRRFESGDTGMHS